MDDIILSSSYSFQVSIDDITDDNEIFYSVEGLSIMYNYLPHYQGGDNNEDNIITSIKTSPLIFKRPLTNITSGFSNWCIKSLETGQFEPKSINIFILGINDEINNHWIAENAYPIGMNISTIDIEAKTPIIVEEIHVLYKNLKRVK